MIRIFLVFSLALPPFTAKAQNLTMAPGPVGCQDALPVDGSGSFTGSLVGAPFVDTAETSRCNPEAPAMWYVVNGTGELITADTCHDDTDFDTMISVYEGSCGNLTCLGVSDDACGLQSSVEWTSTNGTTYFIVVHGYAAAVGDYILEVHHGIRNDFCGGAFPTTLDFLTGRRGTTQGATVDNLPSCNSVDHVAPGVWYTVQGTGESLTADTCSYTTDFDTQISVFQGSCSNPVCVNASATYDGCFAGSSASIVTWESSALETYYVLVHGRSATDVGNFLLYVFENFTPTPSPTMAPRPPNDRCEDAQFIVKSRRGTTVDATVDEDGVCDGAITSAPGVWYEVEGTGRQMIAHTCNDQTDFDTKIAVFSGSCTDKTCVSQNDDHPNCSSLRSSVTWPSILGETYWIVVYGFSGSVGDFRLDIEEMITNRPSPSPTDPPTREPTLQPSQSPTKAPTGQPTITPTKVSESSVPVGGIIGGVLGGLAVICATVVVVVVIRSRQRSSTDDGVATAKKIKDLDGDDGSEGSVDNYPNVEVPTAAATPSHRSHGVFGGVEDDRHYSPANSSHPTTHSSSSGMPGQSAVTNQTHVPNSRRVPTYKDQVQSNESCESVPVVQGQFRDS